ncbi:hypothetical protein ACH79_19945 [Bradyrhizobium sp. CCBAU 051011]|nr:hypothetical protein ACH79_19945 [Bradyrhizobium sp. CCBAU 051011]
MRHAESVRKVVTSREPTFPQRYYWVANRSSKPKSTASKQALDSERVREGLKDALLGPAQLYEALRKKAGQAANRTSLLLRCR